MDERTIQKNGEGIEVISDIAKESECWPFCDIKWDIPHVAEQIITALQGGKKRSGIYAEAEEKFLEIMILYQVARYGEKSSLGDVIRSYQKVSDGSDDDIKERFDDIVDFIRDVNLYGAELATFYDKFKAEHDDYITAAIHFVELPLYILYNFASRKPRCFSIGDECRQ